MGTLSADIALIEERIQALTDALVQNYTKRYSNNQINFDVVKGVKYYKIIESTVSASSLGGGNTSVHAFVSRQTGAVYKPASWRAPAKHARYNLLDDVSFQDCLARADWTGGYLYMR
jgi:hypothetical protein